MDDPLYKSGLSFDSYNDDPKRRKGLNIPIVMSLLSIILLVISSIECFTKDQYILIRLGSMGHVLGLRIQVAVGKIIACCIILTSQMINLFIHKSGKDPGLKPILEAIIGKIEPGTIGIEDEEAFRWMKRRSYLLLSILRWQYNLFVPSSLFVVIVGLLRFELDSLALIKCVLPIAFLHAMVANIYVKLVGIQIIVFFIVCNYCKIKLRQCNTKLSKLVNNGNSVPEIRRTVKDFNNLHQEIKKFNSIYFSKFLGVFWFGFGLIPVLTIISAIKIASHSVIFILLIYISITFTVIFLLVIFIAAAVNKEAFKTYKVANKFFIRSKKGKRPTVPTSFIMKQVNLLEKTSKSRIGFTVMNLFPISYHRCYLVLATLIRIFFKVPR